MAKLRGVLPSVGLSPRGVSVPFRGLIPNRAIESRPRLDAYRNLPEGCTSTSAAVLSPVKPCGRVEIVWIASKAPVAGSYENAVKVDWSSLITYPNLPLGWKAKCRGPAPELT